MRHYQQVRKYVISFLYYVMTAFGVSLTIKANIGVGSINALSLAIAAITPLQVGSVLMIVNEVFWGMCVVFDKRRQALDYFLMALAVLSFGSFINFFVYEVLAYIQLEHYALRVSIFLMGTVLSGFSAGRALTYGVLKFPIERCCELWEARTRWQFMYYRYAVDFVTIVGSLVLSVMYGLDFFVREGTILNFLLFPYIISFAKKIPLKEEK